MVKLDPTTTDYARSLGAMDLLPIGRDPTKHRHVRWHGGPETARSAGLPPSEAPPDMTILDRTIGYVCGCVNVVGPLGALRSVEKCGAHRAEARECEFLGPDYYGQNGALGPDAPYRYAAQLVEAIGEIAPAGPFGTAIEVGCGASPYVPMLLSLGYHYLGIDRSPWACSYLKQTYNVHGFPRDFLEGEPIGLHGSLVLAAHCLEHVPDPLEFLHRCRGMLSSGGRLIVVVPDDNDPLNPDHLWFFNPSSLAAHVAAAGFDVQRLAARRYCERENFLYCVGMVA